MVPTLIVLKQRALYAPVGVLTWISKVYLEAAVEPLLQKERRPRSWGWQLRSAVNWSGRSWGSSHVGVSQNQRGPYTNPK